MKRNGLNIRITAIATLLCYVVALVGFDIHVTHSGEVLVVSTYETSECEVIHPAEPCHGMRADGLSEGCCSDEVMSLESSVVVSSLQFSFYIPSTGIRFAEPSSGDARVCLYVMQYRDVPKVRGYCVLRS